MIKSNRQVQRIVTEDAQVSFLTSPKEKGACTVHISKFVHISISTHAAKGRQYGRTELGKRTFCLKGTTTKNIYRVYVHTTGITIVGEVIFYEYNNFIRIRGVSWVSGKVWPLPNIFHLSGSGCTTRLKGTNAFSHKGAFKQESRASKKRRISWGKEAKTSLLPSSFSPSLSLSPHSAVPNKLEGRRRERRRERKWFEKSAFVGRGRKEEGTSQGKEKESGEREREEKVFGTLFSAWVAAKGGGRGDAAKIPFFFSPANMAGIKFDITTTQPAPAFFFRHKILLSPLTFPSLPFFAQQLFFCCCCFQK